MGAADAAGLAAGIETVHLKMRDRVRSAMIDEAAESLRSADDTAAGDTIYAIDRVSDSVLLELLEQNLAPWLPLLVVAEGLPDVGEGPGIAMLPEGASTGAARFRVVVDPVDGTRGLMYGKRSAWILTGAAVEPSDMSTPTLQDIDVAVQTEIPTPKQAYADTFHAIRGRGAFASRTNVYTAQSRAVALAPSAADTIAHGFGQVMRAFPGGRDVLAAIDDDICHELLGPGQAGKAGTFEDQYISTAGQLAELTYGHDRWVADLRPLLTSYLRERGHPPLLCCHPYDLCTVLVAEEAGVVVTDVAGGPLDAPLVVDADVAWVGYANERIRSLVEPALHAALRRRRLSP